MLDGFKVKVGCWFDFFSIFSGDNVVKEFEEVQFFQPSIDPAVCRTGDHGGWDFLIATESERIANSRHGVEFTDLFSDPNISIFADLFPVE